MRWYHRVCWQASVSFSMEEATRVHRSSCLGRLDQHEGPSKLQGWLWRNERDPVRKDR